MNESVAARHDPLWVPVVAPVIWVLHFMICYIAAALWCGRFASATSAADLRAVILVTTIAALIGIAGLFGYGLHRHRYVWPRRPHDDDTPQDRNHFMAFTTMLLSGLSGLATVFVAIGMTWVPSCA